MTAIRRDGNEAALNAWIRNHPRLGSGPNQAALSIQNLDFIVHRYLVREDKTNRILQRVHFLCIEAKTHGAKSNVAQSDTLSITDQAFEHAHKSIVNTIRGRKRLFYHGLHYLILSGTSPEDSTEILWDQKPITPNQLVDLIRFDINAYTLQRREERNHHKPQWLLFRR